MKGGVDRIEVLNVPVLQIALTAFLILMTVMKPGEARGQACCSGGVPLGGSLGLGAAPGKSFQLLLTYDFNALNTLVDDTRILDDDTRKRATYSTIMEVNYGLNERFSLTGVLPYVRQTRTIRTFDNSEDFTSTDGIGDIIFLLKYRILDPVKDLTTDWVVGAGPKLPTARTDFETSNGLTLPADMQPGSGSLDWVFWSYFQKERLMNTNFGLMAVIVYRYSGINDDYNNTQSYQFGDEFQYNIGPNYTFFTGHIPINLFTFLRYREQSEDLIDDRVFPSTGGKWLYLISGINVGFGTNWSFRLSVELPVYRKLTGTQLTTSYRLTAALRFNLPLKREQEIFNLKNVKP